MFLDNCDTTTLFYLRVNGLSGLLGCAIVVSEVSAVPLLLQDGSPPQSAYLSSCTNTTKLKNGTAKESAVCQPSRYAN